VLHRGAVDLVLLDVRLPDGDGLSVLRLVKQETPETPVVLMTAFSSISNAVEAMKQGAYYYLHKPFNLNDVALVAEKALEAGRLRRELHTLRDRTRGEFGFETIIGRSPSMTAAKALLRRIAASPSTTVLVTGETGTGKDLAAKAIHYNSDRAARPFVNITCSALPEQLLESELFGHERGAFTDARQQKNGLLQAADGGTVFLDEVGEMTPGLQAKLLRFLEDRTFKRIGGLTDIRVDVRVIAATNRELSDAVRAGAFRQDLFYRLQVMPVALPPLRARGDDVLELADYYIARYNSEFRKRVEGLSPEAAALLQGYRWPGNVRELRNAVERAMILTEAPRLTAADFLTLNAASATWTVKLPPGGVRLEDVERQFLVQALERSGGNQTRAGQLLGLNRDQIRYRLEKFRLSRTGEELPVGA
jgi:DNA-binding NtrC family response regulator